MIDRDEALSRTKQKLANKRQQKLNVSGILAKEGSQPATSTVSLSVKADRSRALKGQNHEHSKKSI